MSLIFLGQIFEERYKKAGMEHVENMVRSKIDSLYKILDNYNIIRFCAETGASRPKGADERKAVAGYQFCKNLVSRIDYLEANKKIVSLGQLRENLLHIIKLVAENKDAKFDASGNISDDGEFPKVQFPHVSELIFRAIPIKKKHDFKLRDEQFGKAKTGLSRILSLSTDMLKDIRELEIMSPESFKHENESEIDINSDHARFSPQRAPISVYDIVDFIRQHGDEYGISSQDDWEIALRNDPELKEKMTTVINAINRGHLPKDSADVKMQIAEIMKHHEQKKENNAHMFETNSMRIK